jgi:hypothetical protein
LSSEEEEELENVSIGHRCPPLPLCQKMPYFHKYGRNSEMTEVIYMAVQLDQDIMTTNMCVKFGENWTNTFQELDHSKFLDKKYKFWHDENTQVHKITP